MTTADFGPGQPVKIEVKLPGANGSFDTTVALTYKDMLLLEPIVSEGRLVGFPPECFINLIVIFNNICYIWNDINIQTVSYKGHYYSAIELSVPAVPSNRRGNYRVPIGDVMTVVCFTETGPKPVHTYIKDISESGFAFIINSSLDIGRVVRLHLPVTNNEYMQLSAKIVRSAPSPRENEFVYGCQFMERSNKLSNWIMTYQRTKQSKKNGFTPKVI